MPMNFGSITEAVLENLHKGTSTVEKDYLRTKIIAAMNHFKSTTFIFNQESSTVKFEEGVLSYSRLAAGSNGDKSLGTDTSSLSAGFPHDLVAPKLIQLNYNDLWKPPMKVCTLPEIRVISSTLSPYNTWPVGYCFWGDELLLSSAPGQDVAVRIDYVRDLEIPKWSISGGVYTFTDNTGTQIDDSFTNTWFTEATDLIIAWATAQVYLDFLDDENSYLRMMRSASTHLRALTSQHSQQRGGNTAARSGSLY